VLHRLLYSSTWVTLLSLATALVLIAALMMNVPGWDFVVLAVFAFDAVVLAVLYLAIWHLVHRLVRVRTGPRTVLVRSWSTALSVLLMLPVLLAVQLQQSPPAYLDSSPQLYEMLQTATARIGSECQLIDTLVRFGCESEALRWWLTLRATQMTQGTLLAWLAWGLFLLGGSLSLWAYSAFCTELIHKAHRYSMTPVCKSAPSRFGYRGWFWAPFLSTILLLALSNFYLHRQSARSEPPAGVKSIHLHHPLRLSRWTVRFPGRPASRADCRPRHLVTGRAPGTGVPGCRSRAGRRQ
jgi:hypothetical protein